MKDSRITDYALGELQGRAREEFERELAGSAFLQKELEETLRLSDILGTAIMNKETLEPEVKKELLQKCAANQKAPRRSGKILKLIIPISLAAAACLVTVPAIKVFRSMGQCAYGSGSDSDSYSYSQGLTKDTFFSDSVAQGGTRLASGRVSLFGFMSSKADTGMPASMAPMPSEPTVMPSSTVTEFNTEAYNAISENPFLGAKENPLSTFSIDVDTASYSNVRRFLKGSQMPPAGAIRTEELINYFKYDYPQPTDGKPFSVNIEMSQAPWDTDRELVRIGLKGKELPVSDRPQANLVFLVDVSGSMDEPNKLPLVKRSMQALVENLSPSDRVAIVTYAGSSGLALPSTLGSNKQEILDALEALESGGSTQGSAGIKLAYETARQNFLKEGMNRVILCTDGDFNVGVTNMSELERIIERERASGVFLSVLGFGTGNVKDSTMELLADKGNGNYAYVDTFNEGRKVLVEQMSSTLFTIAKDVKIQVEFNPARVAGYRLIGYENRMLAKEDFNNDMKDAGEIGAGHTVTALYEIIPAGKPVPSASSVDPLKYQKTEPVSESEAVQSNGSGEILTVKLRYKEPDGEKSKLIEVPLVADGVPAFDSASSDFQFASAVAAFGMKLRNSPDSGDITWGQIQKIVRKNLGDDPGSYRAEFLTLVENAKKLPGTQGDK